MELVVRRDLKSLDPCGRVGSSPTPGIFTWLSANSSVGRAPDF